MNALIIIMPYGISIAISIVIGLLCWQRRQTAGAKEYANGLQVKVVLIDGETLANHMIDYGVAVTPEASYEIKRVDSDYFDEA